MSARPIPALRVTIEGMADLRKIADKLGKRQSPSALTCEQEEHGVDLEQLLFPYPTVAILCLAAIFSVFIILALGTLLAFLLAASI